MKTFRCLVSTPGASALAFALALGGHVQVGASDGNPVLLGAWPGFERKAATSIAVSGDYAFVGTCFGVGLDVLDISQSAKPRLVGRKEKEKGVNP